MGDSDEENKIKQINYIGFNYDYSYFCIGTNVGFQVYQTNPLNLTITKIFKGGIGIVHPLEKSNIFCLVGGGYNPRFSPNKLILWDDKKNEITNEYRTDCFIINCYIKQKCIFIICPDSIILIDTKTMELIENMNTINNPKGIFSICNEPKKYVLAFPDSTKGNILIKIFTNMNGKIQGNSLDKKESKEICTQIIKNAHKGNINILCFNFSGTKIASASDRGTTIRIFNSETGEKIAELRRGTTDANIYSLCFSYNDYYLGLTSNHGSCHIFDLKNLKIKSKKENKSMMSYISDVGKYLSNVQDTISWRNFEIPKKGRSFVGFIKDENNNCFILDKVGNYLSVNFIREEPKIIKEKLI